MAHLLQILGFGFFGGAAFFLLGNWLRPQVVRAERAHPIRHRAKRRRRLSGVGLPGIAWLWELWRRRESAEMEKAGLIYLHALLGLLKGGLSLPTALFQIVESDASPFAHTLRRHLAQFKRGEQLGNCLEHFRERSGVRESAAVWKMLEVGYRRGLPLLPLLERRLPGLEADADLRERLAGLNRSMLAQAALVALLPWGLLAILGVFQPELVARYRASGLFWPTFSGSLALEGMGLFCLWLTCRYD